MIVNVGDLGEVAQTRHLQGHISKRTTDEIGVCQRRAVKP